MDNTSKQAILAHLNAVSPEKWDEGDFGPWQFSDLKLTGGKYTLSFSNAAGKDSIRFDYSGAALEGTAVANALQTAIAKAIEQWEAVERGDDDEDDDDDDDDDGDEDLDDDEDDDDDEEED